MSSTHVKKNFQVNTFHDGLNAWMDLYCHCVCPGSYMEYSFSIYKAKCDNRIGESQWRSWYYLICIITRGLCCYNAWLFNGDVTAIGVSNWRKRDFTNYARLHCGIIHYWTLLSPSDNNGVSQRGYRTLLNLQRSRSHMVVESIYFRYTQIDVLYFVLAYH